MSDPVMEYKLEGKQALINAIDRTVAAVGNARIEPILWDAADITLGRLKSNVNAINKVTGRLRASPARRWSKDSAWGKPRAPIVFMRYHGSMAAYHAHLVERGARGGEMPAQPFFRPAIDSTEAQVIASVESHIIKAVEGAWYK